MLHNTEQGENNSVFKLLWSLNTILRATHLEWRVLLDRIPTKVNLAKSGIGLSNKLCEFCKEKDETYCYLFSYCKLSKQLWNRCDSWVGLSSVNHNQFLINFQHFHILGLTNK